MEKERFGRIGILAGGPSSEREISLRSGRAVYNALIEKGLDAVFLDIGDNIHGIIKNNAIDIAFIALHGRFGEDGTIQRILEEAGIAYTGSGVEASRLALDKVEAKRIFVESGIPTPRYIVLEENDYEIDKFQALDLPVVVKPQFEGSSIGLSIVREMRYFKSAIDEACKYGGKVIVEEYIDGREITVGILDDKPLPVIEIVAKNKVYDYGAKYQDPETRYLVPAPIEKHIYEKAQGLGRLAHTALGCRSFSRVDMMLDKRGDIFILEVNTIPGMTERSLLPKAAMVEGLDFGDLCIKLIENALKKKAEK